MKKLSNAIFGKESKFHKDEYGESVTSEKHVHPEYEGAVPVAPVVAPVPLVTTTQVVTPVPAPILREERIEREILLEQPTNLQPTIPIQEEARVEARERPAVVHEKVYQVEREEIQPVIHREREKTEIVQVEVPRYESEIRPTVVHERQLPAEMRPEIRGSTRESELMYQEFGRMHQSTLERAPVEHRVVEKPAIVEEHIKRTIIEEVQPVIHKEVVEPHIIRETLPIYEKIIEAPIVTRIIKEIEGLRLDEHNIHHAHHGQFLRGQYDCLECKRFHSQGVCTVCSPTLSYEGCQECLLLKQKGFVPTQQFVYSKTTPLTSGVAMQSGLGMQPNLGMQQGVSTTLLPSTMGTTYTSGLETTGVSSISQPGFTSGLGTGLTTGALSSQAVPSGTTGLSQPGYTTGPIGAVQGFEQGLMSGHPIKGTEQGILNKQNLSNQPYTAPSSYLGQTTGLSQPVYTTGMGTTGLSTISQPGYTTGLSSGISQPGYTTGMGATGLPGVSQTAYTTGLPGVSQPGFTGATTSGISQPIGAVQGFEQGLMSGQPIKGAEQGILNKEGFGSQSYNTAPSSNLVQTTGGISQPGYTSGTPGVSQPGFTGTPGVSQPGFTSGIPGVSQPSFTGTTTSGMVQGFEQGLMSGQPIKGAEQGMVKGVEQGFTQSFTNTVGQTRTIPESSQTQKFL